MSHVYRMVVVLGAVAVAAPAVAQESAPPEADATAPDGAPDPNGAEAESTEDEAADSESEADGPAGDPLESATEDGTTERHGGEDREPATSSEATVLSNTEDEATEVEDDATVEVEDDATVEVEESANALEEDADVEEQPLSPRASLHGEYRFRFHLMNDLPLQTQPRAGYPTELGQNLWATNWLRLTGKVELGSTFELVGQIDLADGVLFGDEAVGVEAAARPRDGATAFDRSGIDPRWLYAQWMSPVGLFRAGLQPSHWGLGLLANDGTREPVFGDYRYGNRNVRLLFVTRPAGRDVPFNLVLAGDLVYDDPIAQLRDGERALQAIVALMCGDEDKGAGAYVVYRSQRAKVDNGLPAGTPIDEGLDVWILDLFARWEWEEPSGGSIFAAFEGMYIRGDTNLTRTTARERDDVRQWIWAAQVGREGEFIDVVLETGYTSGDANTEDGVQRRATMHPDHRIGLILFPEVMAWSTARSATLARNPELTGRPSPGTQLLPTDGGVSNALYLFNYAKIRPTQWLDLRLGWIWARATSAVVDPYRQRAESRTVSYRGGDPRNRDLGVEVDGAVLFHIPLPHELAVEAGLEGGVFVPGRAWDDAAGNRMNTMGLFRLRAGLAF